MQVVGEALTALYHNPNSKAKEQASAFLDQLQRSPFAWQIADQLLCQRACDKNTSYFAAHTMRSKIYYSYVELPADSRSSLRDSLLSHVTRFRSGPQPVATQLALAVADLAVQMVEWKDAVGDLISRLACDANSMTILIDILTVLPEEIDSPHFKLGSNRRREIADEMRKSGAMVFSLLSTCYQTCQENEEIIMKILRCLASWMYLDAFPMGSLISNPLMLVPFQQLTANVDYQVQEAAADCICSSLYICENSPANVPLAQFLQPRVYSLFPCYAQSVAEEDTDRALNLCRVFTEMAESFIDYLIFSPNEGLGDFNTLMLVLECAKHTDYEVAEKTYNFWYRLSERIYQRDDVKFWDHYQPHIETLILTLCSQCRFDDDRQDIPDSQDDFVEFRHRTIELIYDLVFVIGSLTCFKKLYCTVAGQQVAWPDVEAALYVMQAIAKRIDSESDDEVIKQVLQSVVSLPSDSNVLLNHSALKLVGQLSDWINSHCDSLENVLAYLVRSLNVPVLASEAAFALDFLCQGCKSILGQHFDGLLQIIGAADSLKMSNSAIVGLLRGTCEVLSLLPAEKVTRYMEQLCSLSCTPLHELITTTKKKQDNGGLSVCDCLDRLSAIFRYTSPTVREDDTAHPCQPAIEQLWPMLSTCCTTFTEDSKIIERWCRCIKYALRCLHRHSIGLIASLANQMVTVYSSHPHSSFLYLASILVDEYGKESGCTQGLINMLQQFCPITFNLLSEDDGLVHHPDTVDDLFRLCSRFLQRAPLAFLQSSVMQSIMECALASLMLHHRDAHASVCKFIYELLRSCGNKTITDTEIEKQLALTQKIMGQFGPSVVCQVITGCASQLPSYTFVDLGDILFELGRFSSQALSDWVKSALLQLLADDSKLGQVPRANGEQLLEFHSKVVSAKEQQDVWDAMRYLAGLYS